MFRRDVEVLEKQITKKTADSNGFSKEYAK
jgi:hypothetical protein